MKSQDIYQYSLICCACLVIACLVFFTYRELFPEYKVYQNAYKELEEFRTSYSHEGSASFHLGVKQILLTSETNGTEAIDRCISCHIAMDLPHFSPTRIARDVNNQTMIDPQGKPLLEENPDYVFERLEQKILELSHPSIITELQAQGKESEATSRLLEAEKLKRLKTVKIEGREIALEKVLRMHPLIGYEQRPFENHPLENYGCTSCHSGNGHALVAKRAHGPVFDEEYEPAFKDTKPHFTEADHQNDPLFSRMYNNKPGHDLIFQTTPLLAGQLVEAKCVQCHQSGKESVLAALDKLNIFINQKKKELTYLAKGLENHKLALASLASLKELVEKKGREDALVILNEQLSKEILSTAEIETIKGQIAYVDHNEEIAVSIHQDIERISALGAAAESIYNDGKEALKQFEISGQENILAAQDNILIQKIRTDVDRHISHYQRGKELFIAQACYSCHRIAGFSRTNVGPELTQIGLGYPWYIKESIVWPQADLPTSTMPNFRLDHEELGDLMTFLMAQKGETKAISQVDYHIQLSDWEKGAKMPWERAVQPTDSDNIRAGQLIFATEGCASCHKLAGFNSTISLNSHQWFAQNFPEHIQGSLLAKTIEEKSEEIDQNIIATGGPNHILEDIEQKFPGLISSFYSNFKFAERAYDTAYKSEKVKLQQYKGRLHKILMTYIETYGFGREIAPNLSWSGVWRDDEWLIEHFRNPAALTPKSLMPVMPFDDTKFYVLQNMLHELGSQNRDKLAEVWQKEGFSPSLAYQQLCSTCHGEHRQGNGAVSEWIFPVPKNLRNPLFLQHLTKERAIYSIKHGVKGTPMPPWGEAITSKESVPKPVLSHAHIVQLVDWLYQDIPKDTLETEKWNYNPKDVIEEMQKEKVFCQMRETAEDWAKVCVSTYFEERANEISGEKAFYIRDQFYTAENLAQAQELFTTNCAVCHGKEGAGTGERAASMVEAKPRVLTDIPWLRSEDDMFLLRSIKYGVPGTAMVAWGDQTTAAQRMQLALYIRSLSRPALNISELQNILFSAFDQNRELITEARVHAYQNLERVENERLSHKNALQLLLQDQHSQAEEIGKLYAHLYTLEIELNKHKEIDHLYEQLLGYLNEEKNIYSAVGEQLCAAGIALQTLSEYIRANALNYHFEGGKLWLEDTPQPPSLKNLIDPLDSEIKNKVAVRLSSASQMRTKQKHLIELLSSR